MPRAGRRPLGRRGSGRGAGPGACLQQVGAGGLRCRRRGRWRPCAGVEGVAGRAGKQAKQAGGQAGKAGMQTGWQASTRLSRRCRVSWQGWGSGRLKARAARGGAAGGSLP